MKQSNNQSKRAKIFCRVGIHRWGFIHAGYLVTKWKCKNCGVERNEANL